MLAERLLATLPARFDRVLLVNSGSEANDLAWRIARHATGAHGRHRDLVGLPRRHGGDVRVLPGELGRHPPPATHAAGGTSTCRTPAVASAVESLAAWPWRGGHVRRRSVHQRRHPRAGSTSGRGAAAVHAAGGLYVADEVQAGHGRTGDAPVELRGRPGAGRPGDAGQADGQRLPGRRRLRPRGAAGPLHRRTPTTSARSAAAPRRARQRSPCSGLSRRSTWWPASRPRGRDSSRRCRVSRARSRR